MDGTDQGGRLDQLVLMVCMGRYACRQLVLDIALSVVSAIREPLRLCGLTLHWSESR
jgi:hypothetical protein